MSRPLFPDDVLFSQRLLACAGFYAGKLDGVWGPKTDAADVKWEAEYRHILATSDGGRRDFRTEKEIATLLPAAQRLCRLYLRWVAARGLDLRVISGTRTYREQDALYGVGRPGGHGIVTRAQAGQSNHNFGLAWDVGVFEAGRYLPESHLYDKAAEGIPDGLEWGGDWTSIKDRPHYQVATGLPLAEVRRRFEAGTLRIEVPA